MTILTGSASIDLDLLLTHCLPRFQLALPFILVAVTFTAILGARRRRIR